MDAQLQHPVGEIERLQREIESLKREIAVRNRTDVELLASELGDRSVVDGIPALVVVLSRSGEIERVNQQALNYFGRTFEQIQESARRDLIHPHDLDRTMEEFARAFTSEEACQVELRIRRADGLYPWFQAKALPLKNA